MKSWYFILTATEHDHIETMMASSGLLCDWCFSSGSTQEEESRLQQEEQMGLQVSYEGSNRLSIPTKTLSGRSVSRSLTHTHMYTCCICVHMYIYTYMCTYTHTVCRVQNIVTSETKWSQQFVGEHVILTTPVVSCLLFCPSRTDRTE